jgi:hypothetical protein
LFQLLIKTADSKGGASWSCLAVRPSVGRGTLVLSDELLEALAEALDSGENPVKSLIREGADLGDMYIGEPDVSVVFLKTITNVFVPLAVLPPDDAHLVADEMSDSVKDSGHLVEVRPVPADVDFKKLSFALAAGKRMKKWWQDDG